MVWGILGKTYKDHTLKVLRRVIECITAINVEIECTQVQYTSTDLYDPEPPCPSHLLYGRRIYL